MPKKQIGKKIDEQGNLTDLGYTVTQEEINNWNNKVDKDSYQEITGQKLFRKPIRTGHANSENDFRMGIEIDPSGMITCKNDIDGVNFRTTVKIPTIENTIIDINLPQKSGTIATTDDIPTDNNQLTNGAGFINKDVNNLTNYTLATNTASSIEMSIDNSTYVVSLKLKNAEGTQLGETQTIDLPLESVVVNGAYDSTTKEVVLTLDNGNEIRFSVADLVSGLATTSDLANYVPTSRTVNGKALSSNISLGNKDVGALPDYTLTISHQSAGNPRMVKFASVNYSSKATCFKMGAMTCHYDGVSYQFLTDMLIAVTTAGNVTANIYKFAQSSIGSVDGVARYTGDVFYVNDTTNKIVDFYILCGQWSESQFTPVTKVGSTTIANVTQYSGNATYYSSGTKEWATGCGTTYARSNEIPTKTSELENDSNFATTSDCPTQQEKEFLTNEYEKSLNKLCIIDSFNSANSNGVTINYNKDIQQITLNGTATSSVWYEIACYNTPLLSGNTYTLSGNIVSGSFNSGDFGFYVYATTSDGEPSFQKGFGGNQHVKTRTLTQDTSIGKVAIYCNAGSSFSNFTFNMQINEGSNELPYQPYNGAIVHEKDYLNNIEQICSSGDTSVRNDILSKPFNQFKEIVIAATFKDWENEDVTTIPSILLSIENLKICSGDKNSNYIVIRPNSSNKNLNITKNVGNIQWLNIWGVK